MQATTVTSAKSDLAETTQPIREDRDPAITTADAEQAPAIHSPNDSNTDHQLRCATNAQHLRRAIADHDLAERADQALTG